MSISRRKFLQGLGLMSVYLSAPEALLLSAQAAEYAPRAVGKSKILVLVQMTGGNDGLNTVVPYNNGTYYQLRPTLAVKPEQVLPLDKEIGFNPNMTALHELFKQGKVAVVQGVGYPNPSRSHFRSIEIWQTAQPDAIVETGWLGRYLDCADCTRNGNVFAAVNVDPTLPKTLQSNRIMVPSVSNVFDFKFRTDPRYLQDRETQVRAFEDIYGSFQSKRPNADLLRNAGLEANKASDYLQKIVRGYSSEVKYPDGSFGNGLKFISQMISGGVDSRIFTVSLDGFDTHTNQANLQNKLLNQFSEGVAAFYTDLERNNLQDDVVILGFSEFGRRVVENNGRGTDHGTAAPLYVIGSQVKGGVFGEHPSMTVLDEGDLKYKTDFRSVYATVLDRWMGADSGEILGKRFEYIPFV